MHVDEAGRWLYFTAVGREAGRDPYYPHLYRVSLDGGEPELLTPEDADHAVAFAPSGRYFLDTYSRLDLPPVTLRSRRRRGGGAASSSGPTSRRCWRPAGGRPERFSAKARDGVTDVYGVIFRPSTLRPEPQRTP